jgi:hypothetical protein
LCLQGTFQDQSATASATCKYCSVGLAYNNTKMPCNQCEPGQFQAFNTIPSASCVECKRGFYGVEFGAISQEPTNQPSCRRCGRGQFIDNPGQQKCKFCPKGKYSNEEGARSESECAGRCSPGKYSNEEGLIADSACKACVAGRWSFETGLQRSDECTVCLKGRYNDEVGRIRACTPCPVGTFNDAKCGSEEDHNTKSSCKICGADKYQNEIGQERCKICQSSLKILDNGGDRLQHLRRQDCQDPNKIPVSWFCSFTIGLLMLYNVSN